MPKEFYIEVKMPNSQTSQFVVELIEDKFIYGTHNKFKNNSFSQNILDYLNNNFVFYGKVSEKGLIILIHEDIINKWIISNLNNKNIDFIYSGEENEERVIPINKFGDYFKANAILRRKKSGSRPLPQSRVKEFQNSFNNKFGYFPKMKSYENKYFILSTNIFRKNELSIDNIENDNIRFYLSYKENLEYEVKILSNTNNPNVIFELAIKQLDNIDFDLYDLKMFAHLIIEKMR